MQCTNGGYPASNGGRAIGLQQLDKLQEFCPNSLPDRLWVSSDLHLYSWYKSEEIQGVGWAEQWGISSRVHNCLYPPLLPLTHTVPPPILPVTPALAQELTPVLLYLLRYRLPASDSATALQWRLRKSLYDNGSLYWVQEWITAIVMHTESYLDFPVLTHPFPLLGRMPAK